MELRETAWEQLYGDLPEIVTKELNKQIRRRRRERLLEMTSSKLDVRDGRVGIKFIREGYQPIT